MKGDGQQLPFGDNDFDLVYARFILEHVRYPLKLLNEAKRVLKQKKKIFLQENNILSNEFYPDCPKFSKVWHQFAKLQQKLGGDALIGKKLFYYLKKAGFENIELSFAPEIHHYGTDTFFPWIDNLIGNIEGAAEKLVQFDLCSKIEIQDAINELKEFENNQLASTYFAWNRAKAKK